MINLNDLLKSANGQLFGDAKAQLFTEFCFEAPVARASMMFVALRTEHGDTHADIAEAIEAGASGILCNEPPSSDTSGVTVVIVRDSLDTLMAWSRYVLGRMGTKVIAVAGTSGKSVTAHAIATVLARKYSVFEGDLDAHGMLGIPITVAKLKPDTKYVALKLSPGSPNEMLELVNACEPSIVVINHLDEIPPAMFRNAAQLIDEHSLLLQSLTPGDFVVLNFDEDTTREMASHTRARVLTVGIDTFGADMTAMNIVAGAERTGFDIRYGDEREVGRWSPVLGRHQLTAVLSALMVGVELEVPLKDALKALTQLTPLSGRMSALAGKNGALIIDDTYEANLSTTLAALDWLEAIKGDDKRIIVVVGDLDDLGMSNAYAHRAVGAKAAGVADILVTLGTDASLVGRAAVDKQMLARQIRTTFGVQDAINAVLETELTANDIVLVKGGTNSRADEVVKGLLHENTEKPKTVRKTGPLSPPETPNRGLRPSWKEIDSDAIARNVMTIRNGLAPEVTLMAVVKANGYGHGAVQMARTALANGAGYLGVANMSEAMELRDAGISAPILVLTYVPVHAVRQAIAENITATVYDLNIAQQFNRAARSANGTLNVHIKIDTGMGRLGILSTEAVSAFRHLNSLRNLHIDGIFTHFAAADDNRDFTNQQIEAFRTVTRFVRAGGFDIPYIHAANSPATLLSSDLHFSMVRTGVLMYGLNPSRIVSLPAGIQPALSWKTTILQVKTLPAGHSVGYGRTYTTKGAETIAILPVGYADGLRRSPSTWKEVLVHGQRAPLVGRVSMEKTAINVSHIPNVLPGDEVVLLGRQGYNRISAEEVALWLGTINYEVTTSILPRS